MDPLEAVRSCGGAARFSRLERLTTRRTLDAAVRAGELVKPARGLYSVRDAPVEIVAAAALNGVRSCHTAAAALGLDLVDPPARPHVTCPPGTRTRWPGTVVHRRDVRELDGLTDPVTTLLDCLGCLPRRFALVPVDHALRSGLVTLEELLQARAAMNRNDPRRKLILMADPEAGSPLESVARVDLLDEGYSLRTQRVLQPAGRVDFVIDGWLIIEVDGFVFHATPERRNDDLRRDAELRRSGFVVLRFSWDQVVRQREWWLGIVRDVHAAGRPRGLAR
jgi:very-short-patch-repair endonuclease